MHNGDNADYSSFMLVAGQRYKLWLEENDIEELDEHYVTSIDEQTCP